MGASTPLKIVVLAVAVLNPLSVSAGNKHAKPKQDPVTPINENDVPAPARADSDVPAPPPAGELKRVIPSASPTQTAAPERIALHKRRAHRKRQPSRIVQGIFSVLGGILENVQFGNGTSGSNDGFDELEIHGHHGGGGDGGTHHAISGASPRR